MCRSLNKESNCQQPKPCNVFHICRMLLCSHFKPPYVLMKSLHNVVFDEPCKHTQLASMCVALLYKVTLSTTGTVSGMQTHMLLICVNTILDSAHRLAVFFAVLHLSCGAAHVQCSTVCRRQSHAHFEQCHKRRQCRRYRSLVRYVVHSLCKNTSVFKH